jgi:ABC-type dipeptide/oligopeptide/nickel transport system permease component
LLKGHIQVAWLKFRLSRVGKIICLPFLVLTLIAFVIGFFAQVTLQSILQRRRWLEVFAEVHKQVGIDLDEEERFLKYKLNNLKKGANE